MLAVPLFPLDAEVKIIVDFCIRLMKVEGFIELYEDNLRQYDKPGPAYEATEITHAQLFGHRRYKDREVFYNVLSRFKSGK